MDKTTSAPDNRLAEATELAERRRVELNELGGELNDLGLQAERSQAAEAAAIERAEAAEAELSKLRDGWAGREALLEEAVTRANEATALAAAATAAKVLAEDELATTSVLLAEAKASVDRLTPENAALRGTVAGCEARVQQAEEQLGATVEAAKAALDRVAEAAVQAIAPTAQNLRDRVLAVAQAVPEDADESEALLAIQAELVDAARNSRVTDEQEHGRKATHAREFSSGRISRTAAAIASSLARLRTSRYVTRVTTNRLPKSNMPRGRSGRSCTRLRSTMVAGTTCSGAKSSS